LIQLRTFVGRNTSQALPKRITIMGQDQHSPSRREFLRKSATAATTASVLGLSAQRAQAAAGSNERMRIGFIGPGGRGFGAHVKSLCGLRADGRKIELAGVR